MPFCRSINTRAEVRGSSSIMIGTPRMRRSRASSTTSAERVCELATQEHCGNGRNDDPEVVPPWEAGPEDKEMQDSEIYPEQPSKHPYRFAALCDLPSYPSGRNLGEDPEH